jgi:hypothetical protein
MRFGTWNERSLRRAGSLMAVQEVRWDRVGTELGGVYIVTYISD